MAITPKTTFLGQIPVILRDAPDDGDDFRDVPASDRGNASYADRGMLGSYAPSNREAFRDPADVRHFAGYGAGDADLDRGYIDPGIREAAAYDLVNYKHRSSVAKAPDEDWSSATSNDDDFRFRNRAERSRGFLTRPRIPTEG